jgi:hypothetical protein
MNVLPCMRDWYERNVVKPEARRNDRIGDRASEIMREWPGLSYEEAEDDARSEFAEAEKAAKVRTDATADDLAAIAAISPGRVTYCPGIPTKRFARDIQTATTLTENQRRYVWQIVWRFRRQIPDERLIKIAAEKGGKS